MIVGTNIKLRNAASASHPATDTNTTKISSGDLCDDILAIEIHRLIHRDISSSF